MPWYMSIGIYAAVGALAGIIAHIVAGCFKKKVKGLEIIVFAISLVLMRTYVMPEVKFWYAERSFREMPLYNTISKVEPNVYRSIQQELKKALSGGKSTAEVIASVRPMISSLYAKYYPYASDEAVINGIGVLVDELKQLQAQSPDLCLALLFPTKYEKIDLRKHLDEKTQNADLQATSDVILSGAKHPQPLPDAETANMLMEKVAAELYEKHGNDLAIMDDPSSFDRNKNKVCLITISLYESALRLPQKESSILLRHLISGN